MENQPGTRTEGAKFTEEDIESVIGIQNPITDAYDENIKRYSCSATIVYSSKLNFFSRQMILRSSFPLSITHS